jgi:hypothetical protein
VLQLLVKLKQKGMISLESEELQLKEPEITGECEQIDCEDCSNRSNCEYYQNGVDNLTFL